MPLRVWSGQTFKTTNIINFPLSKELFSFFTKYLVIRRRFLDQQNFVKNASERLALKFFLLQKLRCREKVSAENGKRRNTQLAALLRGKHTKLDLGENKSEHKGGNLAYFNIKGLLWGWVYIQPIERPTSRTTIQPKSRAIHKA